MDQSAILPGSDEGLPLPSPSGLFDVAFHVLPSPTTSPVLPESLLMHTESVHPPLPVAWPYAPMDRQVTAAVMDRIAASGQHLTSDIVFPVDFSGTPAFGLSDSVYNLPADTLAHAVFRNTPPVNAGGFAGASGGAGAIRTVGMNQASTSASVVITPITPSQPVNMPRILPVLRAPSSSSSADGARRERAQLSLLQYVLPPVGRPIDPRTPPDSPVMPSEPAAGPPNVNPFGGPFRRQRASVIQMSPSVSAGEGFVDISGEPARDIHPSRSQHQPVHPYFHSRIHELDTNSPSHRSHRHAVQEYIRSMQRAPRVQMLASAGQASSSQRDTAPVQTTSGLSRAASNRPVEAVGPNLGSSSSGLGAGPQGYREHRSQVVYHDAHGRAIPLVAVHRSENRPVTVATGSSSQTSAVPSYSGFYQPVFRPVDTRHTSQAWNPPYATAEASDNQTESSAGRTAAFDAVSQRGLLRARTSCPYARPAGQTRGEAGRGTVDWDREPPSSTATRDSERRHREQVEARAGLLEAQFVRQQLGVSAEERMAALRQRQEHVTARGEQYQGRSAQEILRSQQISNAEQRRRLIYIPQGQSAGGPPYGRIAASLLQFMDAGAIFMHTDGEPKLILEEDVIAAIAMDTQSFEFDNQFPHNDECIICFEEFELKQEVRVLSCNKTHRFHKHCIDKWLIKNKPNCPICRQILPSLNQPKDAVVSGGALPLPDHHHHPLAHDPAVMLAGPSIPIPADDWN